MREVVRGGRMVRKGVKGGEGEVGKGGSERG